MKNKKAQALVEFILILPIIILLIFSSIDIFNYIISKNEFQTEVSDKINLLLLDKIKIEDITNYFKSDDINISKKDNYTEISVTRKHKWISPITRMVVKDQNINIKRVIPNE